MAPTPPQQSNTYLTYLPVTKISKRDVVVYEKQFTLYTIQVADKLYHAASFAMATSEGPDSIFERYVIQESAIENGVKLHYSVQDDRFSFDIRDSLNYLKNTIANNQTINNPIQRVDHRFEDWVNNCMLPVRIMTAPNNARVPLAILSIPFILTSHKDEQILLLGTGNNSFDNIWKLEVMLKEADFIRLLILILDYSWHNDGLRQRFLDALNRSTHPLVRELLTRVVSTKLTTGIDNTKDICSKVLISSVPKVKIPDLVRKNRIDHSINLDDLIHQYVTTEEAINRRYFVAKPSFKDFKI